MFLWLTLILCVYLSLLVHSYHEFPADVPRGIRPSVRYHHGLELRSGVQTARSPQDVQLGDQIAYIASRVDGDHVRWKDYLKATYSQKGSRGAFSQSSVELAVNKRMALTLEKAKPDILKLVEMLKKNKSKEIKKVAKMVAKHFASDHVVPLLEMLVTNPPPPYFDESVKKISKTAMNNVYQLFNITRKHNSQ